MLLNNALIESVKQQVLAFTIAETERFLAQHPNLVFYAFAYDINAEYGELNLCLNTEEDFANTLAYYQNGEFADNYTQASQIIDLKYNTGDWEHQCFACLYPIEEATFAQIYATVDDPASLCEPLAAEILQLFNECLEAFKLSPTYAKINKTANFIAYSIDHDEEVEDAFARAQLTPTLG